MPMPGSCANSVRHAVGRLSPRQCSKPDLRHKSPISKQTPPMMTLNLCVISVGLHAVGQTTRVRDVVMLVTRQAVRVARVVARGILLSTLAPVSTEPTIVRTRAGAREPRTRLRPSGLGKAMISVATAGTTTAACLSVTRSRATHHFANAVLGTVTPLIPVECRKAWRASTTVATFRRSCPERSDHAGRPPS